MYYRSLTATPVRPTDALGRFRRLTAADGRHFRAHLLRLHPDDLRHRFMGTTPRTLVHRYVHALDWQHAIISGCFVGRSLRGVCELHPISGNRAEIAVSVERRFQRRGIGRALLGRTLVLARNRGLTVLEFRCTTDNQRMRKLVGRFDGATTFEAMEATATIHSLPPTPVTYISEMVEQAGDFGVTMTHFWFSARKPDWSGRCWWTPDLFAHSAKSETRASPGARGHRRPGAGAVTEPPGG